MASRARLAHLDLLGLRRLELRSATLRGFILCLLLCVFATPAFSQTGGNANAASNFDPLASFPPELREKLRTPGDLTLRDSTLRDALLSIAGLWDLDVAFTKDVTGDVNGAFKQRPLHEILDAILTINGYGYQPNGVGIVILSLEELGQANPALQSATLALPITSSEEKGVDQIVEGASMFLSKQGKIQAIAATRSMVVVDYPDRVARVQQFIKDLTATATGATGGGAVKQVKRFPIQYVTAEEIQGVLEGVFGEGGTVASMTKENVVVVYGPPTLLELAERMIKENDVPRPQVRITAYIYDISLDETERFGVNWHHMGQGRSLYDDGMGRDLFGFNSGLLQTVEETAEATTEVVEETAAAPVGVQAGSMIIRSMGANFSLESTIQALDETRGARLLASPQATVQHLEEAIMKAVREVPYQQLTESTEGGAVGTTDFREAGITLTVTPYVAEDNTITLNVQPTFSVLAGFQQGQPIIDTREAKTRVRVDNGQIIVIGGLRQKSEIETVSGIPYLMHWKHFGKFFRAHSTTIVESELVVFIKPEIVYPNTLGDPHDEAAANVTVSTLNQMPFAQDGPFIPYCHDENCPYHHPRPRGVVGVPYIPPECPHHVGKMGAPEKTTFGNPGPPRHHQQPQFQPQTYAPPLNAPQAPAMPQQQVPTPRPAPQLQPEERGGPTAATSRAPRNLLSHSSHRQPPQRFADGQHPQARAIRGAVSTRRPTLRRLPPVHLAVAESPVRPPAHPGHMGRMPQTQNRPGPQQPAPEPQLAPQPNWAVAPAAPPRTNSTRRVAREQPTQLRRFIR